MSSMMPRNPWLRAGFYAWSLGVEAASVIALRTLKIAVGGVAAEAEIGCDVSAENRDQHHANHNHVAPIDLQLGQGMTHDRRVTVLVEGSKYAEDDECGDGGDEGGEQKLSGEDTAHMST